MAILLLFLIGLLLGSFYNVVALSVPAQKPFANRRSACPNCHKTLTPLELIPVASFLFQAGKCRGCRKPISPIYPLIELATGILFAAAPLLLGWTSELWTVWTLISLLMIIFVTDIVYMLIPDTILLFFMALFLVLHAILPLDPWWDPLLGLTAGFGILLLIGIISKGGMGGGDIKLFGVLGFALGTQTVLLALVLSIFYGAFFGLLGMAAGKIPQKSLIPFGPFIVLGTLTALFWGQDLLEWYLAFLTN
ncbi:prepilin peptidase [Bacillus massiliglaciei]|uniref:prepilin peptidase n=1 Tax=Bacillus massiliglaciei TaxID=1816693 RepID=UPI000B04696A|nr:A24 family peptidase [Bacillus massiliglaciei]